MRKVINWIATSPSYWLAWFFLLFVISVVFSYSWVGFIVMIFFLTMWYIERRKQIKREHLEKLRELGFDDDDR